MAQKITSILLVDDDQDDQLLFREALLEANAAIKYLCASNGNDALEKLNLGSIPVPDLIFMDVNMPKMNGIDCLKELQKSDKFKNIPVIMYSTSCSPDYQKQCFALGAVDYMEKPNDFLQLCAKIKAITAKGLSLADNDMPLTL